MKKIFCLIALALLLVPMSFAYWGEGFQDHQYYVVFDEEGEAAVLATISFQNYGGVEDLEFEIPVEDIRIIGVVQEYYLYDNEDYWRYDTQYADVDYTLEELSDSVRLSFDIPEDYEDVTIIIYYKTESYVEEKYDIFYYDFETISGNYDINNVNVYVDVVDDLYMADSSGETEYKENFMVMETAEDAALSRGYYYSDTSESTSSLDPWESFHVTGKYSGTWLDMNWWKVVIGVLAIGLVLVGGVFGVKRMFKKKKSLALKTGIASGALLSLIWGVTAYVMENLSQWVGYQYGAMFSIVLMLLVVLLTFVLFIGPSVLIGFKQGMKEGLTCLIAEIATLFLLFFVGLLGFVFLFGSGGGLYY
ncbi:hypothetical protein HOE07_04515 [archaeon]|nr:hypothetical protein [archaeon]